MIPAYKILRCITPGCRCLASYSRGGKCWNCHQREMAPPAEYAPAGDCVLSGQEPREEAL